MNRKFSPALPTLVNLETSDEWKVALDPKKRQLQVINLSTRNSTLSWLNRGHLCTSQLSDEYLGVVHDDDELALHREQAQRYRFKLDEFSG